MGLKTYNYEIKELGITIPTAYAVIKKLIIDGKIGTAHFAIQSDRDSATNKQPLEIKKFMFAVDRNTNPYETAYVESKKMVKGSEWNEQTQEYEIVEKDGIFTGWEDDIVKQ